ncbi:MAG: RHS repeat-associated core domain-containing protein, partial [Bacteroidaceae bacterium]|nr:RHS repeat-associated core domain-containing protein [Bacteroidaceae bacterium]
AATGDLAEINPLRYRGYYYDSDTALYYLQSRYYDPKIGRFINADGFISTGQGITGNNMFAYCGNNPIIRADCCGHCYYTSNGIWAHDAWEYLGGYERQPDPQTYEELSVLNGGTVTMYKDVPVIRTSILGDSGFSFGGILLGADIQATNSGVRIIRHEYGHTVQLGELGFIGYTYFVVAPSVYFYNLDRAGVLGVHYYSLPWEYEADMYGNVQGRTGYAQQADQAYYAYKVIVSALCGNGVDMSYASRMNS